MRSETLARPGIHPGGNLAVRMQSLSERRQEIIRPVLANPRRFVLLNVRDLAKALGTDAATIVRIVRGMGFENYRAFQHHLHEASVAYSTSLDTMRAGLAGKNGGLKGAHATLDQDLKNLSALRSSVDREQIAGVAARVHDARRILVISAAMPQPRSSCSSNTPLPCSACPSSPAPGTATSAISPAPAPGTTSSSPSASAAASG